jgi:peptidyl-prolyl cis-trans isomerase A (cyclophilin A)
MRLFSSTGLALFFLVSLTTAGQEMTSALQNPNDAVWKAEAPAVYKVKITTSRGPIVLEVRKEWAPLGANRFYNLVRAGFFNDSRFYRIREGSFVQFGIPGKPEIARIWEHQSFPDDPVKESNARGTIAFAMTGPDARTTQLYINLKDNPQQDAQGFAPLGKLVEGMDVAAKLYAGYAEASGGGMRGGKQAKLFEEGNAYLDREFPKLDKLISAEIIK